MKKAILILTIMLVGLPCFANNSNSFKKVIFENVSIEEAQNLLLYEFLKNGNLKTNNFSLETQEKSWNFEDDFIGHNLECSMSITLKYRIAMVGTYMEVSVTLNGVPCDDVGSAISGVIAGLQ